MGRRKLNIHRVHLNLFPDDMAKVEAIVGSKGVSKFVRDCIKEALAEIEPGEDKLEPPYFEFDGGHEPRLSRSGRAIVFATLRRKKISLDEMQKLMGIDDPIDFIHTLLGHKPLSDKASTVMTWDLITGLYSKR